MKENKYFVPASYTVEAAFVVPLLFFLLFTVIWYSFYLHDKIVADAWTAYTAEECRMAAQYGRVPYTAGIELDGYKGEAGLDRLDDLINDSASYAENSLFMSNAYNSRTKLEKRQVGAGLYIKGRTFNGLIMKELFDRTDLSSERRYAEPGSCLRLTTFLFRTGKKLLGV